MNKGNNGPYSFMGRELNIGEQLLADFEKYIYLPLDDGTIIYYLKLMLNINVRKNPELLARHTDKELTDAVIHMMHREINVMTK